MNEIEKLTQMLACGEGPLTSEEGTHAAKTTLKAMKVGKFGDVHLSSLGPARSIFVEYSQLDDTFYEVQTGFYSNYTESRKEISESRAFENIKDRFVGEPRQRLIHYLSSNIISISRYFPLSSRGK